MTSSALHFCTALTSSGQLELLIESLRGFRTDIAHLNLQTVALRHVRYLHHSCPLREMFTMPSTWKLIVYGALQARLHVIRWAPLDVIEGIVPRGSGYAEGTDRRKMPCIPYAPAAVPMAACSLHFLTFTPLVRSHRQNDDSPMNDGARIAGDMMSNNAVENNAAKQAVR